MSEITVNTPVAVNKPAPGNNPAADSLGHLSVHIPDAHPQDVPFLFEQQTRRMAPTAVVSFASHAIVILLALAIARWAPTAVAESNVPQQTQPLKDIIWLNEPGPGGGGGGGGNRMKEPPRKAELPGQAKITVPAVKLPQVKPLQQEKPQDEPKPEQQLQIPAKTLGASNITAPGALEGTSAQTLSMGPGSGGGAGTGTGTGIGPGNGPGLGPGWGGGTGGGAYRPGSGIENPIVLREVKPQYTPDAMRAKIQGVVLVECVVMPDGTVDQIHVVKSLDPTFGLDQEAVKAARQWRFVPGKRQGQPVPVLITIELAFNLR
jgi:TonB family protein